MLLTNWGDMTIRSLFCHGGKENGFWLQPFWGDIVDRQTEDEYCCRKFKEHRTRVLVHRCTLDVFGADYWSTLVPSSGYLFVAEKLGSAIDDSALLGARWGKVSVRRHGKRVNRPLRLLRFCRNNPFRLKRIRPKSANKCYLCGYYPLCCPECGYCTRECPGCEGDVFATAEEHNGVKDPRIKIQPGTLRQTIVELSEWDGSDFVGASSFGVVTKRVVDFLLAYGAEPFVAIPIPANVQNASERKWKLLNRARRPVVD